jgi:hypothetical protein
LLLPSGVKEAVRGFGYNITYWEALINRFYEYFEMYNTFMADMYVIIVLMGLGTTIAGFAHNFLDVC